MVITSEYVKLRVLSLLKQGKKISETVRELKVTDDVKIDRRTVAKLLRKMKTNSSIADKTSPGRTPKLLPQHLDFIDRKLEENDELTAPGLQRLLLTECGHQVSISAIKAARGRLGWKRTGPKYCQVIREPNRVARLAFCERCVEVGETFDDVIFTDESSIWIERHSRICFRKEGMAAKLKPKVKHPYKVHVWAGISKRGATPIVLFTGIMKSDFYVDSILRDTLLPFVNQTFPDGYRFQQDNDPKHKSRLAMTFLKENNVNYWPTPAESPDLNPIEMLWHELKHFLATVIKPRNKEELVEGIRSFWSRRVTPEKCQRYIGHLQKVIPEVIRREGRASGH